MAKGTKAPDAAAWAAAKNHRPDYKKSLADYFATFAVKERGLKKWIEKARVDWIAGGCAAGGPDFPPLDDPPRMLGWWDLHMTHSASSTLLELAGKIADDTTTHPGKDSASAKSSAHTHTRTAIDLNTTDGLDLAGAARAQRKIVAAALMSYQEALGNAAIPEATVTLLAKRYDDAIERLRKVDDSLAGAEQKRGNMVHVDNVRAELAPILLTLASSLTHELIQQFGIERARATLFTDRWFRHLVGTRFVEGIVPNSAPTTAAA